MHYPPSLNLAHHNGSIVVDSHVHADSMVARKLDDRVIGHDSENEHRRAVLDLNERQSDLALGEPFVVEVEDQPVTALE